MKTKKEDIHDTFTKIVRCLAIVPCILIGSGVGFMFSTTLETYNMNIIIHGADFTIFSGIVMACVSTVFVHHMACLIIDDMNRKPFSFAERLQLEDTTEIKIIQKT